jgi:putative transposase
VVSFIEAHRARRGIGPICSTRQIASNSYYAAVNRAPSARRRRDAELRVATRRVWDVHRRVSGADTVWAQPNRDGIRVARCTVERSMRDLRLRGVVRGRPWVRTTLPDPAGDRPADLVARPCRAPVPNRPWLADLTSVTTHRGWVYVAFIVDVFSRFVIGWQASRSPRTDLALDALEIASCARARRARDRAHPPQRPRRAGRIQAVVAPHRREELR